EAADKDERPGTKFRSMSATMGKSVADLAQHDRPKGWRQVERSAIAFACPTGRLPLHLNVALRLIDGGDIVPLRAWRANRCLIGAPFSFVRVKVPCRSMRARSSGDAGARTSSEGANCAVPNSNAFARWWPRVARSRSPVHRKRRCSGRLPPTAASI